MWKLCIRAQQTALRRWTNEDLLLDICSTDNILKDEYNGPSIITMQTSHRMQIIILDFLLSLLLTYCTYGFGGGEDAGGRPSDSHTLRLIVKRRSI